MMFKKDRGASRLSQLIEADLADEQRTMRASVSNHPSLLATRSALDLLGMLLLSPENRMKAQTLLLSFSDSIILSPDLLDSGSLQLLLACLPRGLLRLLSSFGFNLSFLSCLLSLPTSSYFINNSLSPRCLGFLLLFTFLAHLFGAHTWWRTEVGKVTIREDSSTPEEASKITIWAVTRAQKILEGEGDVILVVGVVPIVVFGVVVEGAAAI
jgi:hypothetical protein